VRNVAVSPGQPGIRALKRLPRAITLDLDDTLWPVAPAIERAEAALEGWLRQHAPGVLARHDLDSLRALRDRVALEHPHRAHDFTWVRRHSLGLALQQAGHDPALAEAAFDAFFAARNVVELYDEVDEALALLSARLPLFAVTNGNADLVRTGVARHFVGIVSARSCGVGKPDRRIFEVACAQLGLPPADVLHVGDDWALDVLGAQAAGLQTVWLCRGACVPPDHPAAQAEVWVIAHLGEVVQALDQAAGG
jgi:putative hydrolase of the HAD superfamily